MRDKTRRVANPGGIFLTVPRGLATLEPGRKLRDPVAGMLSIWWRQRVRRIAGRPKPAQHMGEGRSLHDVADQLPRQFSNRRPVHGPLIS